MSSILGVEQLPLSYVSLSWL